MRRTHQSLIVLLLALATSQNALAATIAYWRMETDDDVSADGLSVPNELGFGTPLTSSEAELDNSVLPIGVVPLTLAPNSFAAAARYAGGTEGINASAAWYPELAVTSVSIEYWARTSEGTATPFRWTTGGADGIVITDPNTLNVTWYVNVSGTPTGYSMTNLDNMDAGWSHYAFTYDETSGTATFYVDGIAVNSFDGPNDAPLVIVANTPVELGVLMDFSTAGQGTLDEVRIDGSALAAAALLTPEPSTATLVAMGLVGLAARRRHR